MTTTEAFGKQGCENRGVFQPRVVAITLPVAAGIPAFLRGLRKLQQASKSTVTPRHRFVKTYLGGFMGKAGQAFEDVISADRFWDRFCIWVLIAFSLMMGYRLAEWAYHGFRVVGQ